MYIIYSKSSCPYCVLSYDLLLTYGKDKTANNQQNIFVINVSSIKFVYDSFINKNLKLFKDVSYEKISFSTVPQIFYLSNNIVDVQQFIDVENDSEKLHNIVLKHLNSMEYIGTYTMLIRVIGIIKEIDD